MTTEKELMGASTSLLLLAALATEPSYGYQLVKRLADESHGLFQWQEGTIYPLLHRLQNDGLVRAQWQESPDTRRRRKYYHLTAKGRHALADQTAQWHTFHNLIARMTGASDVQPRAAIALP